MFSGVLRLTALAVTLLGPAIGQIATLRIQVVEGEGAVHAPGSRSRQPITVEIRDETGAPVRAAAVTFHLPESGPSGICGSGLRTDVAVTDVRGRASLRGIRFNRTPGPFQIRILAAREQARAGIVSSQYIGEAPAAGRPRARWVAVAAALAGGAAAGVISANRKPTTSPGAPPSPTVVTTPPITIGSPSTTVGRP